MSAELIQAAPVEREAGGWWTHPGYPSIEEDMDAWNAWKEQQRLEFTSANLEGEDLDHPAYVSYYDEESNSVAGWDPEPPTGEGWFPFSIHDTEDGPMYFWARRIGGAAP